MSQVKEHHFLTNDNVLAKQRWRMHAKKPNFCIASYLVKYVT